MTFEASTGRRFFLDDAYVQEGEVLKMVDGRQARIVEFARAGTLPVGTWVCDPRNMLVCQVTEARTVWPVVIADMCCEPTEILPVLEMID